MRFYESFLTPKFSRSTVYLIIIVLKRLTIQYLLEALGLNKYFTKLLHVCNRAGCVVVSTFEFTVNEATTSSY